MTTDVLHVLVTSGGGFQGLAVVRGLAGLPAVRIVLADCFAENVTKYFAHRFYRVPLISEGAAYTDALLDICRREDIRVIIPSTAHELEPLAEHRDAFMALGVDVLVSRLECLRVLSNKRSLHRFLTAEGIATLPEVDPASPEACFPLIAKPEIGWGGRDVVIVNDLAEFARHRTALEAIPRLWQPYLRDFEEFSFDLAIGKNGKSHAAPPRRRLRTFEGFAVVTVTCVLPEAERLVRVLAERLAALGGYGMFNIQVLRSGDDYFVSDVNPRIGTSAVCSFVAGFNPLHVFCDTRYAAGHAATPERSEACGEVKVVRSLCETVVPSAALQGVTGVVFDLDDTLLDHKRWIYGKLSALWCARQEWLPPQREFVEAAMRLVEEGHRANLLDELCVRLGISREKVGDLIGAYRAAVPARPVLYTDSLPCLAELRRRGFRLGLLTDNPPESQRVKLQAHGLEQVFDAVVFSRECGGEKPRAGGFQCVAADMNASPGELVAVGDSLYRDMRGALDAGFRAGFWIPRAGALLNDDAGIFDDVSGLAGKYARLESLQELILYLPEQAGGMGSRPGTRNEGPAATR